MDELKQDVKEIKKDVASINVTLARLTTTVEVHEKRSTMLEGRVGKLEKFMWVLLGGFLVIEFAVKFFH